MVRSRFPTGFSVLCAATLVSLVVMPLGISNRNPPFHKWGGLDVPNWVTAFSIELAAALLCLMFRGLNLANRYLCWLILAINLALLIEIFSHLLLSVARGTI